MKQENLESHTAGPRSGMEFLDVLIQPKSFIIHPNKNSFFDESTQKPQQRPDPIFVGKEGNLGACFFLMYPKRTICPHQKNITKPCPHKKPRNTAQHQRNAVCCQQGVEKEKGTPQG